ncbi:hypothetical protein [Carbonactinospora thermoautotrophica]|nr:hypothetical protein [Carbonactinospora thermoautotrophica]
MHERHQVERGIQYGGGVSSRAEEKTNSNAGTPLASTTHDEGGGCTIVT